ncbi:ABC transporter permease [Streptomyces sp. NPDC001982]|uniref:ABC transporter permease n=1 Tax=Streptomyces sp. NPDC001982 TaxID=3154405 RepID=UPI003327CFB0
MRKFRLPDETGIFLVLLVVLAVLSILSPSFGTVHNGLTLLLNGAVIAFLALGQTFVLLTGGIDLSTGANVAMTGVLAAVLMRDGLPWLVASLLAVGAGLVLGVINGLVIHYVKVPPFIVTFSTQGVATAVPLIITGANSISVRQAGFSWIGQGRVAGVPLPVIMLLVAAVAAGWFLIRTRLGVHVYASGGNKAAARLAGVDIRVVTILAYAVSGVCGGIAGLIATSRLMVGFPATGLGNELFFSIAAAVVGGVSLFGGTGTVAGAMIGAVLIASVSNGMNVLNVSSYWQSLVIGSIILLGVSFDTYRRGLSGRSLLGALTSTSRQAPQKEPTAV